MKLGSDMTVRTVEMDSKNGVPQQRVVTVEREGDDEPCTITIDLTRAPRFHVEWARGRRSGAFFLAGDEDEMIAQAAFRAFGPPPTIRSGPVFV